MTSMLPTKKLCLVNASLFFPPAILVLKSSYIDDWEQRKLGEVADIVGGSTPSIGNTTILAKEGTTNQGFQSIVPHKEKLDSYFIFSRTHELKRYGETNGAGSTFVEVSGKQMA